jgi:hypothetical protein
LLRIFEWGKEGGKGRNFSFFYAKFKMHNTGRILSKRTSSITEDKSYSWSSIDLPPGGIRL